MERPRVEERLQYGGQLRTFWIDRLGQPTSGGPTAWGLGEILTNTRRKTWPCYETFAIASGLDWSLVRPKHWQMFLRLGSRNLRILYRSVSIKHEMTGHVACIGGRQVHTWFLLGNLRARDRLDDRHRCIILKWILRKWDGGHGLDWCGSG